MRPIIGIVPVFAKDIYFPRYSPACPIRTGGRSVECSEQCIAQALNGSFSGLTMVLQWSYNCLNKKGSGFPEP